MSFSKKSYFSVKLREMTKVLFVCLGNICRSPMAEGIFQHLLETEGLTGSISCDSAGTAAYHVGNSPDPRTIEVLEKNGIYTNQRARQLRPEDFEEFDHILVMDKENLANAKRVQSKVDAPKAQLELALNYASDLSESEVPDPYYGGINGFDYVYDLLDTSLRNFLGKIS